MEVSSNFEPFRCWREVGSKKILVRLLQTLTSIAAGYLLCNPCEGFGEIDLMLLHSMHCLRYVHCFGLPVLVLQSPFVSYGVELFEGGRLVRSYRCRASSIR